MGKLMLVPVRTKTETASKTFTNTEKSYRRTMFWTLYENFRSRRGSPNQIKSIFYGL